MPFGFDPSLILSANRTDPSSGIKLLADLAGARMQQQVQGASLADMLRRQRQEQSLADILRQNAGQFSDPVAASAARAGLLQAPDLQANAENLGKIHAQVMEERRRRDALADPNSPTSNLRRNVANQFGANLDQATPGNAVDDKEMELLERALTAKQLANLRYGSGAVSGYSPEAIDTMAQQVLTTGRVPQFGPGATGAALRQAVFNRVSELAGGATPGQRTGGATTRAVPDLGMAQADFGANSKSLEHSQTQADAVNSFTRTLDKNLGILEEAQAALDSSNSPLANKPLRWLQANASGDPNLTAYLNALNTVRSEAAKINSGSTGAGGAPISVLEEMSKGLPDNATPAQINAAIKVYRQDSENRRSAMNEQIGEIRGRMGAKGKAAPKEPNTKVLQQRIGELKAQGLDKKAIKAQLKKDGLL
jgi:hypothetical protein